MRSAACLLSLYSLSSLFAQTNTFDVVITGGRIIDGSGNPWYYGDLGIRGDTIAAIGKLDTAASARRLDVHGLVIAPGFIDIHTHARRGIFQDQAAQNYIRQGVTTL